MKENRRERRERSKRRGREKQKKEIFLVLRWLELDGLRRKVDPHIVSYEIGNFTTSNIFSLKVM